MGKRYRQVTIEERCEIARLQAEGRTVRQIAADLDRSASTVARELKRNGSKSGGRQPVYADQRARARRRSGSRLERDEALRAKCSPASNRAGRRSRFVVVWPWSVASGSYPTRAFTGASMDNLVRKKDYSWRHYLPRGKSKRGWRGRKEGSPASFIHLGRPLAEGPQSAQDRRTPGHWEADLMLYRTYGQAVLTMHERHSRLLIARRPQGKASAPIAAAMARVLAPLPREWRQTVTLDNGTEFARRYQLHDLGIETFFCDIHSPWQKGGVENGRWGEGDGSPHPRGQRRGKDGS